MVTLRHDVAQQLKHYFLLLNSIMIYCNYLTIKFINYNYFNITNNTQINGVMTVILLLAQV